MLEAERQLFFLKIDLADQVRAYPRVASALAGEYIYYPGIVPPHGDANQQRTASEVLTKYIRTIRALNGKPEIEGEHIALLMATSGSTGKPKVARLTSSGLTAAAEASARALGGHGQWMLGLPANHIAGMQVVVRSVFTGSSPVCMNLLHGFNVDNFYECTLAAQKRVDRRAEKMPLFTSLTPMLVERLCAYPQGVEGLQHYDKILVGGGVVSPAIKELAKEHGLHLVETYGSTETCGGVVYDGKPFDNVQIHIADDGRVQIQGPMVSPGYLNAPNDCFIGNNTWQSSDLGSIDSEGILHITGRADSIIETGGLKIHPEVVETLLNGRDGIESSCLVGVPDDTYGHRLALLWTGGATEDTVRGLLDGLEKWARPKAYLHVDEIPRTPSGKVDRYKSLDIAKGMLNLPDEPEPYEY